MNQTDTDGAPIAASRGLLFTVGTRAALVAGIMAIVGWAAFLAVGLTGAEAYTLRLLSDVLLGLTLMAGFVAQLHFGKLSIAALVTSVAYVFAWRYIGWNLLWGTGDVLYYTLVVTFYIAPLLTGVLAVLASRFGRRIA